MVPSGLVQVMVPVGGHRECPAAFVGEVVVPAAERGQIVDVGSSVVAPETDVMDLALVERHLATPTDTGAVHCP